jgi:hypothetical protein
MYWFLVYLVVVSFLLVSSSSCFVSSNRNIDFDWIWGLGFLQYGWKQMFINWKFKLFQFTKMWLWASYEDVGFKHRPKSKEKVLEMSK